MSKQPDQKNDSSERKDTPKALEGQANSAKQPTQKTERAQDAKKTDRHAGETSVKMAKQVGVSARTYDKMEYIDIS